MAPPVTPERLSLMIGLVAVMLAAVPRYLAGGHETRLTLISIALAVVAAAAAFQWRLLGAEARLRLGGLLRRLGLALLAGLVLMGAWHAVFSEWMSWEGLVSQGTTLGLLLHAVWLWVKAPS
jgi:hypothetical protein